MTEPQRIFAAYPDDGRPLATLGLELLAAQQADWPALREGYGNLDHAGYRKVACTGFAVTLQWNPKRIVSGSADIDPEAIRARPCFLCQKNLPALQRAVLYRGNYLVLCNPAPIFAKHFTIACTGHQPQAVEPALGDFLRLIKDLSPQFSVFYNGPRCGASAPDHLHFQAAPFGAIPVEGELLNGQNLAWRKHCGNVAVFEALRLGRSLLVLEGADSGEVAAVFRKTLSVMRRVYNVTDEPMINLLGAYRENRWRILIFPRRRHRPAVYDREGAAQVLISPGTVDMGGLVITPLEKDFRTADAVTIQQIFRDVSVDEERVAHIIASL